MSIHDELERIAARAPEVVVPADTWGRAQRARRRQRVVTVAAVLTVVALAGALTWLPSRTGVDPADSDTVGVPQRLWSVPERMSARENDGSWMRDEVTADVTKVGVGAAAWVTDDGLPVVVDARSGAYHLLDLPDFAGNNWTFAVGLGNPVVALSPDGTRLAYGYAVFGPDAATAPIPSGIRIVDLGTGESEEVPLPGGEGTAVSRIAWSPSGTWLAFAGTRQGTWTEHSMGSGGDEASGPVLGRIALGPSRAEVRDVSSDDGGIAVDDGGVVRWTAGQVRAWDGEETTVRPSEDAELLDLQLGRTADGDPVRLTGPSPRSSEAVETRLGVVSIVLDPVIGGTLTIATGLMTRDRPTVDRPEPDWPTDWGFLAEPGVWLLVGIVVVAFAIRPIRRLSAGRPTTGPAAH